MVELLESPRQRTIYRRRLTIQIRRHRRRCYAPNTHDTACDFAFHCAREAGCGGARLQYRGTDLRLAIPHVRRLETRNQRVRTVTL